MKHNLAFRMDNFTRNYLTKSHKFYVKQASIRILSRFENIEQEANAEFEKFISNNNKLYDAGVHCPSDLNENAYEVSIEFYDLLSDMQYRTRLSVIAGMFHEWDKQIRDWLSVEIRNWHIGNELNKKIWSVNFSDLMKLIKIIHNDPINTELYRSLDACNLIVNITNMVKALLLTFSKRNILNILKTRFLMNQTINLA